MTMIQRVKDGILIALAVIVIVLLANSCSAKEHKYEEGLRQEGYNNGYRDGRADGYDEGYSDGEKAGYNDGYEHAIELYENQ